MRQGQADREERFRTFYREVHPDVLGFARRRTEWTAAEDAVAEAFLIAWRRFEDLPTRPEEARAWAFGIVRNCLLNLNRTDRRTAALAVRIAESPPAPPGLEPDLIARRVDLAAAWRMLTPVDQEALALNLFEDLSSAQAAQVLGIKPAAYRLRLSRARRNLRDLLNEPDRIARPAPASRREPAITCHKESPA